MKKITDRPGRYFGVFIFAPMLLYCGFIVRVNHNNVSITLIFFSILLFVYEMFWICFKQNKSLDCIYINEVGDT
jgi:hypothetical protein